MDDFEKKIILYMACSSVCLSLRVRLSWRLLELKVGTFNSVHSMLSSLEEPPILKCNNIQYNNLLLNSNPLMSPFKMPVYIRDHLTSEHYGHCLQSRTFHLQIIVLRCVHVISSKDAKQAYITPECINLSHESPIQEKMAVVTWREVVNLCIHILCILKGAHLLFFKQATISRISSAFFHELIKVSMSWGNQKGLPNTNENAFFCSGLQQDSGEFARGYFNIFWYSCVKQRAWSVFPTAQGL